MHPQQETPTIPTLGLWRFGAWGVDFQWHPIPTQGAILIRAALLKLYGYIPQLSPCGSVIYLGVQYEQVDKFVRLCTLSAPMGV